MDALELTPGVDLLHSMRSVGYSFEAAVADLIDNSITAGASNVDITVDVVNGEFVTIADDGAGMNRAEAIEALRLAGTARIDGTGTGALGRFGLGLKTASLSQARRLEVITVRDSSLTALAWDIDYVMKRQSWSVQELTRLEVSRSHAASKIPESGSGTVIVWSKLDYLRGNARDFKRHLNEKVRSLRQHLSLVFHRFLEKSGGLAMTLNGTSIEPTDPFLSTLTKTQRTHTERVKIEGHVVALRGYTLPHSNSLPVKLRSRPDLGKGLKENQGFYVYRNKRLISHGGWFGLIPKDELTKQARVRVDITDDLDFLWQIDIRKSRSEAPPEFKSAVRPLMDRLVQSSKRVHTFKGRKESSDDPAALLWNRVTTRDGTRFAVNEQHPSVVRIREALPEGMRRSFADLLDDLAVLFPHYDVYLAGAEGTLTPPPAIENSEIRRRLEGLRANGHSAEDVAETLAHVEPFNQIKGIETLIQEVWT